MLEMTHEFINRIFVQNHTEWWKGLVSETPKKKYGESAKFLETALEKELEEFPGYRMDDRRLYFFSSHVKSSIDGRYKSLGVEEKYNPLDLKEHLIDGAIHRGLIWSLGNPHCITDSVEAVSLYVVKKGSLPIDDVVTDIFFPVLTTLSKVGVYIIFINETTGEYWNSSSGLNGIVLPSWLSVKSQPQTWDLCLEMHDDSNRRALSALEDESLLAKLPQKKRVIPSMGKKGEYTEYTIAESCRVAIIECGNQWRLLELGLLLRALGYSAVKAVYNRQLHKNTQDRTKLLRPAGKGVETKIAEEMLDRYAVKVDWQVDLQS